MVPIHEVVLKVRCLLYRVLKSGGARELDRLNILKANEERVRMGILLLEARKISKSLGFKTKI